MIYAKDYSFEKGRDLIRNNLNSYNSINFPIINGVGTDIYYLLNTIFQYEEKILRYRTYCLPCSYNNKRNIDVPLIYCDNDIWNNHAIERKHKFTMQKWVDKLWLRKLKHVHCDKCNKVLSQSLKLEKMPLFIPFIVQHVTIHIDFEILVQKQSYF